MNWRDQIIEQMAHVADPGAFDGVGYGAGAAEQSREDALSRAGEEFDRAWSKLQERLQEVAHRLERNTHDGALCVEINAEILREMNREFKA